MFLRGEQVALVGQQALVSQGPLTQQFGGKLNGLPEPFASCSEAAIMATASDGVRRTVFIAGDMCVDWKHGVGAQYTGLLTGLANFGSHLPAEFRSDVDVLLQRPSVNPVVTLLIKGDRCTSITWGKGATYTGPLSGLPEAGWKKLPADMRGDFDHAVMLPNADGNFQTLFVKGDRAMQFDWIKGPKSIGAYAEVLAGLGALPAEYRRLRLPAAGRFTGTTAAGDSKVELRVDLAGEKPVVSGDFFDLADGVETYATSFILDGGTAVALPATIIGTVTKSDESGPPVQSVEVDKLAPGGIATLTLTGSDGAGPTVYTCDYVSRFLRTIDWEIDYVKDTEPPGQYATTEHQPLPAGLDKKIITVQSAFADAGIELRMAGKPNEVPVSEAGEDRHWSAAELHAAMAGHFSLYRDEPQWKLWNFIADSYINAEGKIDEADGVMFDDTDDVPRQGVATFYNVMKTADTLGTRDELFTYIHEIGHALNLAHSWQKDENIPPSPLGPCKGYGDKSFMNYQQDYREDPAATEGDEALFWKVFTWRFTPDELRHLRHGFYSDVVFGGSDMHTGGAHLADLAPPAPSRSGLRVQLSGREAFSHGEPVTVEIKVSLDGSRPTAQAADDLTPGGGHLSVLVTDPAGQVRPFRPIARPCGGHRAVTLDATTPALYGSAYLGYGAAGFTFPQPGTYRLQARYRAPDGSTVVSPDHSVQINPPADEADRAAGDLLLGDQQGTLLALRGSDAPQLADGNAALDRLIADHPDHPLTVHARLAKGANAGRHFLTLTDDGITVRTADTETSIDQLNAVVETTLDPGTDAGVDNITLNEAMRRLARAHARGGDLKEADAVLDQLVETFRVKDVPGPVLATVNEQAETTRAQLHAQP
ncbi:hypothetical protein Pta02_07610 [Planobispora takensis]|uniref:Uncharacterized protein n=2 Tax=Planobispora takensis TaxID=1367882 RepID=A0A8J3SR47_9ACTN|nr:hypothetical protein Pta02_07610 [Planobispora takensis]